MMVGRRRARMDGAQEPAPRPGTGHPSRMVALGHRVAELYEQGMMWCLARPRAVFAAALGLILLTALVLTRLPREILPQVDEGTVVADVRLPEGTALDETIRQVARIEAAASGLGSEGIYARVGLATDEEVLAGADPGTAATGQLILPVPAGRGAAEFAD